MLGLGSFLSQLSPNLRGNVTKPYYNPQATTAALAAGQSKAFTYLAQDIVQFGILALVGRAWIDGAPDTAIASPPLTVEIKANNGDQLTNGPVLWDSVVVTPFSGNVGVAGLPQVWLQPGTTIVTVTVAVIAGAASSYWAEIDLVGINVYNILKPEAAAALAQSQAGKGA